ncbi:MAG TPA: type II toxin-antitoxin system HicB family antitoxin [Chloroflexota bacterium]|nr:type II toxin-antitoxin system HicB family antitoxin [Chloroflexota bacterium]
MLSDFINAAMRQAGYEMLSDGSYYGEISGFQGVWANARSLDACRKVLQEVLENWIVLGVRLGHTLPIVDSLDLNAKNVA